MTWGLVPNPTVNQAKFLREVDSKSFIFNKIKALMAESEGFEPPVAFRLRLISSQVHSTGLCHLSVLSIDARRGPAGLRDRPVFGFPTQRCPNPSCRYTGRRL